MKLYQYILMATNLAVNKLFAPKFLKNTKLFSQELPASQWFNELGWLNKKTNEPVLIPIPVSVRFTVFGKR